MYYTHTNGHKMMYSVKPGKVYYVFEISRLLGPTSISRNPGMTTNPKGTKNQQKLASGPYGNYHLAQERCEFFRLKKWIMKWVGVYTALVSNSNLLVLDIVSERWLKFCLNKLYKAK
jgi:hypothetical protein